jgi:hypothetical protein
MRGHFYFVLLKLVKVVKRLIGDFKGIMQEESLAKTDVTHDVKNDSKSGPKGALRS